MTPADFRATLAALGDGVAARCRSCKHSLPLSAFGADKRRRSGLRSQCRQCASKESIRRAEGYREAGRTPDENGQCSRCKRVLPASAFRADPMRKHGLRSHCRGCESEAVRAPSVLARKRAARDAKWESYLLYEIRYRAKRAGVAFNLSPDDIVIPDKCPVLGIPLVRQRGQHMDGTPTVDRIRPALGYVRGNVMVISWRANRLKCDSTDPAEFDALAAYLRRMLGS